MRSIVATMLVLGSSVAFAGGKPQRKAFEARITEAKKDFKATCGCELAINVKWDTFKSDDDFMQAASGLPQVSSTRALPCADQAGKAAVCKLKTLEVSYAGSGDLPAPTLADGTAKVCVNRQGAVDFDSVTDLLDPEGPGTRKKTVEYTETLARAAKSFKDHCGCSLTFDIDWAGFSKSDHLGKVAQMAESFSSIGSTWQDRCTTPASRAALCKMKTVKYVYVEGSPEASKSPVLSNGVMTNISDGLYGATVDSMMEVLEPR